MATLKYVCKFCASLYVLSVTVSFANGDCPSENQPSSHFHVCLPLQQFIFFLMNDMLNSHLQGLWNKHHFIIEILGFV